MGATDGRHRDHIDGNAVAFDVTVGSQTNKATLLGYPELETIKGRLSRFDRKPPYRIERAPLGERTLFSATAELSLESVEKDAKIIVTATHELLAEIDRLFLSESPQ